MEVKKVVALIISIIFVLAIVGIVVYMQKTNNKNDNNIYAKTEDGEQSNLNIVQTDDGLIFIKGGTFEMGSPQNEAQRNEDEVQHSVTVSDFYIGKYEVT